MFFSGKHSALFNGKNKNKNKTYWYTLNQPKHHHDPRKKVSPKRNKSIIGANPKSNQTCQLLWSVDGAAPTALTTNSPFSGLSRAMSVAIQPPTPPPTMTTS